MKQTEPPAVGNWGQLLRCPLFFAIIKSTVHSVPTRYTVKPAFYTERDLQRDSHPRGQAGKIDKRERIRVRPPLPCNSAYRLMTYTGDTQPPKLVVSEHDTTGEVELHNFE